MRSAAELRRRIDGPGGPGELRAELQESLRDLLECPGDSPAHRATCDRVMRACIQRLSEGGGTGPVPDDLPGLAELAYRGYRASTPSPAPLYAERLLFHLLRASALSCPASECLTLADHLYRDLSASRGRSPVADYEAVAKNGFGVLWKRAEDEEGGSRRQALSLRLSSLRFLALLESGPPPRKLALACGLYEKGLPSPLGEGEAGHLARVFEEVLLPSLGSQTSSPSPLFLCQLTVQCCSTLCRWGHPSLATGILSRARGLLPAGSPPHYGACLGLCRLAALLRLPGEGEGRRGQRMDRARGLLLSLPTAPGPDEARALGLGCQQLAGAGLEARRGREGASGGGNALSAQELLAMAAFLGVCLPLLRQEEDGARGRAALLKQCYQNLESFTSRVYDYLLESQGKEPAGARSLVEPCRDAVGKMVEMEEALTEEGLSEYAGVTALRVYNLAYGFYSHKLFSEAVEVAWALGTDGPLPNWFCRSPLPQERVPKFYRLLADCCRKAGRPELALDVVTVWLGSPAVQGPGSLSEPVALWVSLKSEAVKNGNEELQLRTLKDALEPWGLEPCSLAALLCEELQAYKRLRADTAQERFNVVCDLLRLADEEPGGRLEQERAMHLVELAQVLCYRDLSQHTQCSATDCAEEALAVLGSLPETPANGPQLWDDQARAYLWLYICDLETRIQASVEQCLRKRAAAATTHELEEGETNDVDYEDRQQGSTFPHDCIDFNLRAETQRCMHLDKALSLWKSGLSGAPAPALRSSEQTVHDLHLTAALYRLMDKPFQAIESYGLSLRLLDPQSDPLSVTNVLLHIAEVLLLLESTELAGTCLDKTELLLRTSDPSKSDYPLLKTTYSLLRSQQLYTRQQVPEGLALLLDVLQTPSLQKPSKVWYLLKAKAQQLTASYLSLPASVLPTQLRGQLQEQGWSSAESALTDSHKVLCGIVMLLCPSVLTFGNTNPELTSSPNSGDNLFQKWLVLSALITCSCRLVQLLTGIGSAQEAKMFCLETLRLTAKLQCVRPCAAMLVASAELELQRGDLAACGLDLEQMLVLLDSKADFGTTSPTSDGRRTRKIRPSKGRVARGEGRPGKEGGEEEGAPSFLRVRPFAPAPCPAPWAQAASPVLQPRPLSLPRPLAHPPSCPCPPCADPALTSASLRWALVRAGLEERAGAAEQSQALLQAVLERACPWAAGLEGRLARELEASGLVGLEGLQSESPSLRPCKVAKAHSQPEASGPAGQEEPGSGSLRPGPRGLVARAYSQLAWLSLVWEPAAQSRKLLQAGQEWPGLGVPGPQEVEQARASLLLGRALSHLGQLSQRKGCGPAGAFAPAWSWSLGRAPPSPPSPPSPPPSQGPVQKARLGSKPRKTPGVSFQVLEDRPSPAWDRPRPRARTRLQRQFDDSEAEGTGGPRETGPPSPPSSPPPPSSAKTRTAAPRKRQARSAREGARGAPAKRGGKETESRQRAKPGSRRQPRREAPESEVLRRCESAHHPVPDPLAPERKGGQPPGDAQHPPSAPASSADVTTLDSVYTCLLEAVACVSHCPPSGLYARACRLLALCVGSRDPHTTAFLLSESLAITSRHQMLQNLHRKAVKNRKARGTDVTSRLQELRLDGEEETGPQTCYLSDLRSAFQFWWSVPPLWVRDGAAGFREQLQEIPQDTVVCLLTLAAPCPQDTAEVLLLTRLEKGRVPVTVQILARHGTVSVSSLLAEFDAILKEQKEVSSVTELKAWWEGRTALDQRMKHLVDSLEAGVLGCWRGLLLPSCPDPQLQQEAAALARFLVERGAQYVEEELLQAALGASHLLTLADVCSLSEGLSVGRPSEVGPYLRGAVDRLKTLTGQPPRQSCQLILMLDKDLQRLPWESMPSLRGGRVSRLPSFPFLLGYTVTRKHQLKSVLTEGVDPGNVFYVLNPQGNLPNTEKTFKAWFQRKEGWDGVVGRGPSQEQLRSVLCNRDLYVYAGHGAGVRFLEGQEIQKLSCRAASLLVGCSSASLALRGDLEGVGIVLKYMMAGCPLFLGNLWDVTDKDIDRYTEQLLRGWLSSEDQSSLLDHISRARQAPKLKYLIGASPVVYGLNVSLQ